MTLPLTLFLQLSDRSIKIVFLDGLMQKKNNVLPVTAACQNSREHSATAESGSTNALTGELSVYMLNAQMSFSFVEPFPFSLFWSESLLQHPTHPL